MSFFSLVYLLAEDDVKEAVGVLLEACSVIYIVGVSQLH